MIEKWEALFAEVRAEMMRSREKFGDQRHKPLRWNAIIGEEKGEAEKALVEYDQDQYRRELIHVAATSLSAAYCFDVHGIRE